jgi:hypothetical protein
MADQTEIEVTWTALAEVSGTSVIGPDGKPVWLREATTVVAALDQHRRATLPAEHREVVERLDVLANNRTINPVYRLHVLRKARDLIEALSAALADEKLKVMAREELLRQREADLAEARRALWASTHSKDWRRDHATAIAKAADAAKP